MKRKRHTPEEIIKKLREASGLMAAGKSVEEACRALGVSAATYQRWKSHYGGVKKDAIKRLRELLESLQRYEEALG
jgi:transcriptional regulator with XRE-family HTH domain